MWDSEEEDDDDESERKKHLDYEDNSNFSLKHDELLVHWANRCLLLHLFRY